jgi:hypothetical protein
MTSGTCRAGGCGGPVKVGTAVLVRVARPVAQPPDQALAQLTP